MNKESLGLDHGPDIDPNKKLSGDGFQGPTDQRKCTDILFLILIILAWIILTAIGSDSCVHGDPWTLIAQVDYGGRVCGYSSGVEDSENIYYLDSSLNGVCVNTCPPEDVLPPYSIDDLICKENVDTSRTFVGLVASGDCQFKYASTNRFGICIFTNSSMNDVLNVYAGDQTSALEEFAADIYTARGYVFGFGFVIAIVMGFLYTWFLHLPGVISTFVWSTIILIFLLKLALGAWLIVKGGEWEDEDPQMREDYEILGLKVLGGIVIAVAVIYACLIIFLRKRIQLAVGIIKEAGRSLMDMPAIIFFPLLQVFGLVLFMVPWVFFVIYTASMGDIEVKQMNGVNYKDYVYSAEVEERGWYLLFMWFWTTQFIIALGQIVLAAAVAKWYFTRDKKEVGTRTVFWAIKVSLFYHVGTAAFGSLVIAIIKMIRFILMQMQKQAQKQNNKLAQAVLCCCQCCMWCVEKCMKFVNRHAYIQTAIFSTSFCVSAKNGFFLLLRNIARASAVELVSEIIILIGKIFISLMATFLSYATMEAVISDDLNSLVAPTVMVFILAWVVAIMFMMVFHMAIDTVFQCFIADEEMFEGDQRFAQHDLAAILNEKFPKNQG
uniref:Choline transporter-like protein n=1 Tax=Fibrocapsa japonica TaxID=94617 RepID=A0A7S2XXR1_9STRA|mmetsp:Transcript_20747/g.30028  ORF Transcript_20747/g.30028 Transcript_20747/m.30028 type:complete len:607 (+) Transcript_20747:72-1892(+)